MQLSYRRRGGPRREPPERRLYYCKKCKIFFEDVICECPNDDGSVRHKWDSVRPATKAEKRQIYGKDKKK